MNKTQSNLYNRGFVSLFTTIATGILVLTTMAAGVPSLAEAPEENTVYMELAHHYGVEIPRSGLSDKDKNNLVNARKVEQYYRSQKTDMPLADQAYEFVVAADKHGIDYALMPAIARFETSGGRNMCRDFNAFGWSSCNMAFDSFEHAFDHIAWSLSGENPNTSIYSDKSNDEILLIYNPPTVEGILPGYHKHILKAIKEIKSQKVEVDGNTIG